MLWIGSLLPMSLKISQSKVFRFFMVMYIYVCADLIVPYILP
jgi:hypothetical protein